MGNIGGITGKGFFHGYALRFRPIYALLIKKAISFSLYLVQKVMKLAGFFGLPKKRRYPKGNY